MMQKTLSPSYEPIRTERDVEEAAASTEKQAAGRDRQDNTHLDTVHE